MKNSKMSRTERFQGRDHVLFLSICGKPFQAWEMWPSPHSEKPVGSEVWRQDPHPWIGSPMGNQALIVPRPLQGLLFAKTPSP